MRLFLGYVIVVILGTAVSYALGYGLMAWLGASRVEAVASGMGAAIACMVAATPGGVFVLLSQAD